MTTDYQAIIDKYYPAGTLRRDIYMKHCRQVADLALELAHRAGLDIDDADIVGAAMLHDVGIFMTSAPSIGCHGEARYIAHGPLGADLLRREGAPEAWARVAETHTGSGITAADVETMGFPFPAADYCPKTMLEKLVCYADKFYSKSGAMERKTFHQARTLISRHGGDALARFDALAGLFGQP